MSAFERLVSDLVRLIQRLISSLYPKISLLEWCGFSLFLFAQRSQSMLELSHLNIQRVNYFLLLRTFLSSFLCCLPPDHILNPSLLFQILPLIDRLVYMNLMLLSLVEYHWVLSSRGKKVHILSSSYTIEFPEWNLTSLYVECLVLVQMLRLIHHRILGV